MSKTVNELYERKPPQRPQRSVEGGTAMAGDAASAIFLLRDYSTFGLSERVCYHFDLMDTQVVKEELGNTNAEDVGVHLPDHQFSEDSGHAIRERPRGSGVLRLLEMSPASPMQRLTRRQKKSLRAYLREFNLKVDQTHKYGNNLCYQPLDLPLRCNHSTSISFGYEFTRIAFCVDASSSLTSSFGVNGCFSFGKNPLCPLDQLPEMARLFFNALVEPISTAFMVEPWKPRLSVSVIAVYPMGEFSETSLLVRDFQVHDAESARRLSDEIETWTYSEVESGISERLFRRQAANKWSVPLYTSDMRHILEAGDYSLQILSSEARPIIVVATDARSVSCASVLDVSRDGDRIDVPVHILDLSMPETHVIDDQVGAEDVQAQPSRTEVNFLSYDPGGSMGFPVHLTDDSEAIFMFSCATGGCFLDHRLLFNVSKRKTSQQLLVDDSAQQSTGNSFFKRRFLEMNGLQLLALFSVSPITPTFKSSWNQHISPFYVQRNLHKSNTESVGTVFTSELTADVLDTSHHRNPAGENLSRKNQVLGKTTFSIYVVSPVRIKALILMRIKEGYRTKQYGMSTHDPDKVFIQFTLPMESGIILHYELSYKALSSDDHMVGSAHIKIELSGDTDFVQLVKNEFLKQLGNTPKTNNLTFRRRKCAKLCQVIHSIRRDDILQSFLKPSKTWSSQLVNPGSPFARRLGGLTRDQRRHHYETVHFDVACTGFVPYSVDNKFMSQFVDSEDGIQELTEALAKWSNVVIKADMMFVKLFNCDGGYCIVEVLQSERATQLYSISLAVFASTDPEERLNVVASLKDMIGCLKRVEVLRKQMSPFIAGRTHQEVVRKRRIEIQFHHASWDLVMDAELLPLLTKRRIEIGRFCLLTSSDDYALFAKLVPTGSNDASPDDLAQYQIAILEDKVVVDLHMESESGVFNPFQQGNDESRHFVRMVNTIRRRDQECGRALRSRTNLLQVFYPSHVIPDNDEDHRSSVNRILAYCSRVTRKLRFFTSSGGANSILTHLTSGLVLSDSFEVKATKLDIGCAETIHGEEPGIWFVQQYDRQIMSIVHLSIVDHKLEEKGEFRTFRDLTLFTYGIGDLYSKRDDLADDDSIESHISEYLCVSEFGDKFEAAQQRNFALAAYLALRQVDSPEDAGIDIIDMTHALASLRFVEVSSVLVTGSPHTDQNGDSKLLQSIKTILRPVPAELPYFYYFGVGENPDLGQVEDQVSDGSSDATGSTASSASGLKRHDSEHVEYEGWDRTEDVTATNHRFIVPPHPIFVTFQIDGIAASINDLNTISRSCLLKTFVSLHKVDKIVSHLPDNSRRPHFGFASEITALLKSYVAERTLERLRGANDFQSEDQLQLVRKCMSRIKSVECFYLEIFFFVSQRGVMMPAGAPAGGEAAVKEGFVILDEELRANREFSVTRLQGQFYLITQHHPAEELTQYWCLVNLQSATGQIFSQVYHPEGLEAASKTMKTIHGFLCTSIHKTNQHLLLRSLHRTKMASELMIPTADEAAAQVRKTETGNFPPGTFSCNVVFHTLFDLYQRAATSPGQVARTLEATVLHNFAVSNRPGIFVYKDESGAIFYMELKARGNGIDSDGQVELMVYGLGDPGPSVTDQLRILLQRRLLLIAVDMLSNVLTKNPHFKWKSTDFGFLRSFEMEWKTLENNQNECSTKRRYYKFPSGTTDPCMVLLILRQNLCGSTFFHRLNDIDQSGHNPSPSITAPYGTDGANGTVLKMNQHEFSLYYNSAPSKLEPAFQGVSTLTEKGAEYCRLTGTGIAMIEFTLVKGNGEYVDEVAFAENPSPEDGSNDIHTDLRVEQLSSFPISREDKSVCARVTITDTALNRDALHDWICLTLNQALVAWVTERWLERSLLGIIRPSSVLSMGYVRLSNSEGSKRERAMNRLCPGLPILFTILDTSYDLPHSAFTSSEYTGITKSSSVASVALGLLQRCILGPLLDRKLLIFRKYPEETSLETVSDQVHVLRISRNEGPLPVCIRWADANQQKALVTSRPDLANSTSPIEDSPIDCPEYIFFYFVSERHKEIESIDVQLRLFREVIVHDGMSEKSASIDLLESIKEKHPEAFQLSIAFVFSVKRNGSRFWGYNWNPQVLNSISIALCEKVKTATAATSATSHQLQRRSLGVLSPRLTKQTQEVRKKIQSHGAVVPGDKPPRSKVEEQLHNAPTYTGGPTRRIRRPATIRRPKLIGKSVEGAAMQAVAASRKRASSNQFKNRTAPMQGSSRDSSKCRSVGAGSLARLGPSQQLVQSQPSAKEENDAILRIRNDYLSLCSANIDQQSRLGSILQDSIVKLANIWWPRFPPQSIHKSIVDLLSFAAPSGWKDVCLLPPLPGGINDIFLATLARWIVAITPGLEVVPLAPHHDLGNTSLMGSIFLCSTIRIVRGSKCCVVVRISLVQTKSYSSGLPTLVKTDGRMVILPRRTEAEKRRKMNSDPKSANWVERDAAGMDTLLTEVHLSLGLERLLFDFSASMVERAVRLLDDKIDFEDLVHGLRELMRRCPYQRQKRIPQLNYRVFEGTLVLKSFRDRFIDMFDSNALFERLRVEAGSHDLLECGEAMCFKKPISVKGTQSICFITLNSTDYGKMELVMLCRTQGVNISDFVFREGSNVAIHILDNIALECGRLAWKEVHNAAKSLLRDRLWKSLTTKPSMPKKGKSLQSSPTPNSESSRTINTLYELSPLVHIQSLLDSLIAQGSPHVNFLFSEQAGLDWNSVCSCLKQCKALSTPTSLLEGEGPLLHLFYMKSFDIFLQFKVERKGELLGIDIIEKVVDPTTAATVVDAVANCILHFIWHQL